MFKKEIKKRRLKNRSTQPDYPKRERNAVYPDLPLTTNAGRLLINKILPLAFSLLFFLSVPLSAQYVVEDQGMMESFTSLFEETNVSNLHLYASNGEPATVDYPFMGNQIPRGLFGLFADNWRNDLPADFAAYAVYQIKYGIADAYIMRFAGFGTQNMLGLFTIEENKVRYIKTLANHYCSEENCWQMDTWIQDFDGDTRLDLLQKARTLQYTLMDAPVSEYSQLLLQTKSGEYVPGEKAELELERYNFSENQ